MDRSFFILFGCIIAAAVIYSLIQHQRLIVIEDVPITAKRSIVAFCLVTLILAAVFTGLLYPSYRKSVDIQRHGLQGTADVVSTSTSCGRGGCRYWVIYRYSVPRYMGGAFVKYMGEDQVDYRDLDNIRQSGQVPIAFAKDNPDRSAENIGDIALANQLPSFLSIFYFLMGLSVAGGIVAIAFSGKSLRRSAT